MTTPAESSEARERYLMDKVRALETELETARKRRDSNEAARALTAEARDRYAAEATQLRADLDAARVLLGEMAVMDHCAGADDAGPCPCGACWWCRTHAFLAPPAASPVPRQDMHCRACGGKCDGPCEEGDAQHEADSPVPAEPTRLLRRLDPLGAYRTEDDFVSDFEGQRDALETLTASRCSALFDGDYLLRVLEQKTPKTKPDNSPRDVWPTLHGLEQHYREVRAKNAELAATVAALEEWAREAWKRLCIPPFPAIEDAPVPESLRAYREFMGADPAAPPAPVAEPVETIHTEPTR